MYTRDAYYNNYSRYVIAIHNRKDNTVTFRPTPLYDLTRTVKALKNIEPQAVSQAQRAQARNILGEAFGTKKAKAAIRAAERNRVDVGAMKDVQDLVVESVRGGTSALPTKGEPQSMVLLIALNETRYRASYRIVAFQPTYSHPQPRGFDPC